MKAALLTALNEPLEVVDLETTALTYGQVRVKMFVSGICGAQLQEIRGEKGNAGHLPHLLGHEGCGEVLEIGAGVTRVKVGDKVVCHWRKAAGIESDFPKYIWQGKEITSGKVTTLSEESICSENRLTPVPENTPDELCALLGCSLSTALGTIESERIKFGESVLVIGCGGLGLALLAALDLTTPSRVCVCDIHENKRKHAGSDEVEFVNLTREKIAGNFDLILDTAGAPATMEQALEHMAPSGRYVMIGQPPPGRPVCIKAARHLFDGEGKTIRATQGGGFRPDVDIPRYLKTAESLFIHNLITHRFSLKHVNDAIDSVKAGEAGRVMVEMNQ